MCFDVLLEILFSLNLYGCSRGRNERYIERSVIVYSLVSCNSAFLGNKISITPDPFATDIPATKEKYQANAE
jgi:hypothetical protein